MKSSLIGSIGRWILAESVPRLMPRQAPVIAAKRDVKPPNAAPKFDAVALSDVLRRIAALRSDDEALDGLRGVPPAARAIRRAQIRVELERLQRLASVWIVKP